MIKTCTVPRCLITFAISRFIAWTSQRFLSDFGPKQFYELMTDIPG